MTTTTTVADAVHALLCDAGYVALTRGNGDRRDAVRAMAADDYAQEFLDAAGHEAYATTLHAVAVGERRNVAVGGRLIRVVLVGRGLSAWRFEERSPSEARNLAGPHDHYANFSDCVKRVAALCDAK